MCICFLIFPYYLFICIVMIFVNIYYTVNKHSYIHSSHKVRSRSQKGFERVRMKQMVISDSSLAWFSG